jgi:hypothetical protein
MHGPDEGLDNCKLSVFRSARDVRYKWRSAGDNKIIAFNNSTLVISNQYQFSNFRVRAYFDDAQIEMGRILVPYRLHRDVLSEEYDVNLTESNHINIHWEIDGSIFNYDPIERITLKKRFNRLIWVEKNLVFKKSRER